jgi:hypothetical protein
MKTTLANYRREASIRAVGGNLSVIRKMSTSKAALALEGVIDRDISDSPNKALEQATRDNKY